MVVVGGLPEAGDPEEGGVNSADGNENTGGIDDEPETGGIGGHGGSGGAMVLAGMPIIMGGAPAPAGEPAASATNRGRRRDDDSVLATTQEREALFAHLEEALANVGFLNEQNPAHLLRDVRSLFARAQPTVRDVKVWRGIARQVNWAAGRVREPD